MSTSHFLTLSSLYLVSKAANFAYSFSLALMKSCSVRRPSNLTSLSQGAIRSNSGENTSDQENRTQHSKHFQNQISQETPRVTNFYNVFQLCQKIHERSSGIFWTLFGFCKLKSFYRN